MDDAVTTGFTREGDGDVVGVGVEDVPEECHWKIILYYGVVDGSVGSV